MVEPRLSVVKRDLKGLAKVMKVCKCASFPDAVLAMEIIARGLEVCVSELEALQKEIRDQADCLGDHLVAYGRVEKRVGDLETQVGLAHLKGEAEDFEDQ